MKHNGDLVIYNEKYNVCQNYCVFHAILPDSIYPVFL